MSTMERNGGMCLTSDTGRCPQLCAQPVLAVQLTVTISQSPFRASRVSNRGRTRGPIPRRWIATCDYRRVAVFPCSRGPIPHRSTINRGDTQPACTRISCPTCVYRRAKTTMTTTTTATVHFVHKTRAHASERAKTRHTKMRGTTHTHKWSRFPW